MQERMDISFQVYPRETVFIDEPQLITEDTAITNVGASGSTSQKRTETILKQTVERLNRIADHISEAKPPQTDLQPGIKRRSRNRRLVHLAQAALSGATHMLVAVQNRYAQGIDVTGEVDRLADIVRRLEGLCGLSAPNDRHS
jgi:hypothetical protein